VPSVPDPNPGLFRPIEYKDEKALTKRDKECVTHSAINREVLIAYHVAIDQRFAPIRDSLKLAT